MPIGSESDRDIIRPKHQMAVPGLGVFIAPNAVARLFQLHDYTKCPRLGPQKGNKRMLYPILRPNVMRCPRYYHLRQAARFKNEKRRTVVDVERNLTRPHIVFRRLLKDAQKVIHRITTSKNLAL
ncbi:MAG: hypothetical protein OXI61_01780 [Candidatus Poribacteria bacterium]|nr:hypothetical protein [Candidatus Poribacteria bacterium]